MDYNTALMQIVNRRRDELYLANIFLKDLIRSNKEFRDAELNLRAAELDYAAGKLPMIELKALEEIRDSVIAKLGVEDKLHPQPHCPLCSDTGRVDGELCKCVRQLALTTHTDNVDLPVRAFDQLDLTLFPKDKVELISRTASELSQIAEKGDKAKRKNINLIGKSGTGKTFLAGCLAGAFLARQRSVVFITAFSFVDRALKYHTSFENGRAEILTPVLDSDLLIIDDLGTESILKNVTLEYLYFVINERQLRGLTTVITSNLTINGIAKRYGERIASRLFDNKLCYTREFDFEDIRKIKL